MLTCMRSEIQIYKSRYIHFFALAYTQNPYYTFNLGIKTFYFLGKTTKGKR